MQCTSPVWIPKSAVLVPCGRCLSCKIAHSREWVLRLMHEKGGWNGSVFVCWTYRESDVPQDGNISKKELQDNIKRIRKRLSRTSRKIKYFAIGDYGEKFGRPHYHAIVFGLEACGKCIQCSKRRGYWNNPESGTDCFILMESWPFGFVDVGSVTEHSCRYVCDYMMDKGKGDNYYGKVKPFQLQSQGLGLEYAWNNYHSIVHKLSVTFKGVDCCIPRYYVKKLGIKEDSELLFRIIKKGGEKKEEIAKIFKKKYSYLKGEELGYVVEHQIKRMDEQRNLTLQSRMRLRNKNRIG